MVLCKPKKMRRRDRIGYKDRLLRHFPLRCARCNAPRNDEVRAINGCSYLGDTFNRNQNTGREGHYLRCTSCRRVFWKEFFVDFIDYAEIVTGYHEDCDLYNLGKTGTGIFKNS